MSYLQKRFKQSPNLVTRKIDEETILVPIVNTTGDMDSIYLLNEMGSFIWDQIDGTNCLEHIREKILDACDAEGLGTDGTADEVDAKSVEADLIELVEQLLEIKSIEEVQAF